MSVWSPIRYRLRVQSDDDFDSLLFSYSQPFTSRGEGSSRIARSTHSSDEIGSCSDTIVDSLTAWRVPRTRSDCMMDMTLHDHRRSAVAPIMIGAKRQCQDAEKVLVPAFVVALHAHHTSHYRRLRQAGCFRCLCCDCRMSGKHKSWSN